ncbi:DNA ligase [Yersinia phage vB_YenP_AP10]|uniref:DNA ligase n=1 Tax=Yersinia phage vB_YenP_AP10 TaxID=1735591 RepID=A0A0P0LM15_9CAUD|nr:DNA ligase [Yersinia phage vB_YenP_AP10]ALK86939.1 DNA ligase [Yersinia phage vB_YenP_AP10]
MNIKTNPFKAVSFVESAVKKALDVAGYLIADVKYDGVRGNICVDNTANAQWLSRVSKTIPALEHLNNFDSRWQKLLADDRWIFPDGFMLDGELMVKGVDFNTGSGLLRTKWLKAKNYQYSEYAVEREWDNPKGNVPFHLNSSELRVVLYDIVPLDIIESGDDYDTMTLLRQEHVKNALPILREHFPEISWELAETYEVYDYESLWELYEEKRAEGHEGLIVKDPQGIYKRGKKSGWWKMKPECEADGVVVGLNWGTPGLANEGKVIGFEVLLESGRVVSANNISQALMDEFTKAVFDYRSLETAYDGTPGECFNGWACQVNYMEETPDGSLRHPSWAMWRGTEADPTVKM